MSETTDTVVSLSQTFLFFILDPEKIVQSSPTLDWRVPDPTFPTQYKK